MFLVAGLVLFPFSSMYFAPFYYLFITVKASKIEKHLKLPDMWGGKNRLQVYTICQIAVENMTEWFFCLVYFC